MRFRSETSCLLPYCNGPVANVTSGELANIWMVIE